MFHQISLLMKEKPNKLRLLHQIFNKTNINLMKIKKCSNSQDLYKRIFNLSQTKGRLQIWIASLLRIRSKRLKMFSLTDSPQHRYRYNRYNRHKISSRRRSKAKTIHKTYQPKYSKYNKFNLCKISNKLKIEQIKISNRFNLTKFQYSSNRHSKGYK